MSLMIKGGRVLDPATATDKIADIYIEDGGVKTIGAKSKEKADDRDRCGGSGKGRLYNDHGDAEHKTGRGQFGCTQLRAE